MGFRATYFLLLGLIFFQTPVPATAVAAKQQVGVYLPTDARNQPVYNTGCESGPSILQLSLLDENSDDEDSSPAGKKITPTRLAAHHPSVAATGYFLHVFTNDQLQNKARQNSFPGKYLSLRVIRI